MVSAKDGTGSATVFIKGLAFWQKDKVQSVLGWCRKSFVLCLLAKRQSTKLFLHQPRTLCTLSFCQKARPLIKTVALPVPSFADTMMRLMKRFFMQQFRIQIAMDALESWNHLTL